MIFRFVGWGRWVVYDDGQCFLPVQKVSDLLVFGTCGYGVPYGYTRYYGSQQVGVKVCYLGWWVAGLFVWLMIDRVSPMTEGP